MNLDKELKRYEKLGRKINAEKERIKKRGIQATNPEGRREDILNPSITGTSQNDADLKRNSYKTYQGTVKTVYDMYNGTTDYGSEYLSSVITTRVAFICGGGVTVIAEKEKVADSITEFLKYNKLLQGSKLFENVETGELEGKDLMILKQNDKKEQVDVRNFYCVVNPYVVNVDERDNQIIKSIVYKSENDLNPQEIAKLKNLVYVKLGGTPDKINNTMPVIGKCLTNIENASRILYDMRFSNHLYGRPTPVFQTNTTQEASALNKTLAAENWKIGKAFCGTAKHYMVGPPPEASEVLEKELIANCRVISINTGIPIHWLSYPELMSNRNTAETLIEVINAATAKPREIWQEALRELVLKAGRIAFERGYKDWTFNIDEEEFEIKLPLITIALLKQIQETWIPLSEMGYIRKDSVRNKIPGINPLDEKKGLEREQEEKLDRITNKFKNDFDHNHEDEDMDESIDEEVMNDT